MLLLADICYQSYLGYYNMYPRTMTVHKVNFFPSLCLGQIGEDPLLVSTAILTLSAMRAPIDLRLLQSGMYTSHAIQLLCLALLCYGVACCDTLCGASLY